MMQLRTTYVRSSDKVDSLVCACLPSRRRRFRRKGEGKGKGRWTPGRARKTAVTRVPCRRRCGALSSSAPRKSPQNALPSTGLKTRRGDRGQQDSQPNFGGVPVWCLGAWICDGGVGYVRVEVVPKNWLKASRVDKLTSIRREPSALRYSTDQAVSLVPHATPSTATCR